MWDMRLATSSIPSDVLRKMLVRKVGKKENIEERKKLARFYLQAERYREAGDELKSILNDFPDDTELQGQLAPSLKAIRQHGAENLLRELKRRRDAGQHALVLTMLKKFPSEDLSGETLQAVRELIQQYEAFEQQRTKAIDKVNGLLAKVKEPGTRQAAGASARKLPRSWATTRWIAWRPSCKTPTTPRCRPTTGWRWP